MRNFGNLGCKRYGQGMVIKALPFMKETKCKTSTLDLIPQNSFYNLIDNNFIIGAEKNRLNQEEYQSIRNQFINSVDLALILYAYQHKDSEDIVIVTEETGYNNDGKVFKKIPENSKAIGVRTMNLPEFLSNIGISLSFHLPNTTLL